MYFFLLMWNNRPEAEDEDTLMYFSSIFQLWYSFLVLLSLSEKITNVQKCIFGFRTLHKVPFRFLFLLFLWGSGYTLNELPAHRGTLTDGRGCNTRCQLHIRSNFGVQYLAQGYSGIKIKVQIKSDKATGCSDRLLNVFCSHLCRF